MSAANDNTKAAPLSLPRPIAAVMSSGYFGFFAHAGFLQGLKNLGVEPDFYAGSSSGALVAGRGLREFKEKNVVITGPPTVFTKDNIDNYKF